MYLTITYSRHTTSHFFDIKQRRRKRERECKQRMMETYDWSLLVSKIGARSSLESCNCV